MDLPEYPSRRRTEPIRMRGKKVVYNGGYVEEPKPRRAEDRTSLLYGQLMFYFCQIFHFNDPTRSRPEKLDCITKLDTVFKPSISENVIPKAFTLIALKHAIFESLFVCKVIRNLEPKK